MVAAVSAVFPQTSSEDSPPVNEYTWFKMPDLNRATHRRLGKSGAGWTFETIRRLVHHVGRVGRPKAKKAAREFGRLSVGLQAIADESGLSVAKIRRDLVKLVDLGLVAVVRRNVEFKADPATGKILENRKGRSLPVVVFLTVGPEHCRTKAGQDRPAAAPANQEPAAPANQEPAAPANQEPATPANQEPAAPANLEGPPLHDRDHSGGAILKDLNTDRASDGDAVGIGTPPPAGKAGGHAAAKASHEGPVVRQDAGSDDLPVPVGRISRPAGRPQTRQAKREPFKEDPRESHPFVGNDNDRFQATLRRLEAEQRARDAEDAAHRERRLQAQGQAAAGKAVA